MFLTGRKYIFYLNVTDCRIFEEKLVCSVDSIYIELLSGLFKFYILFLNILLVLIGIIPYSGFTGWVGWLFEFYGISTFVCYLTPNPFLCK